MGAPEGEPVSVRPALRLFVIALFDFLCIVLLYLGWKQWPDLWWLFVLGFFFCIPFNFLLPMLWHLLPTSEE